MKVSNKHSSENPIKFQRNIQFCEYARIRLCVYIFFNSNDEEKWKFTLSYSSAKKTHLRKRVSIKMIIFIKL